jgi:hypothetical protein
MKGKGGEKDRKTGVQREARGSKKSARRYKKTWKGSQKKGWGRKGQARGSKKTARRYKKTW